MGPFEHDDGYKTSCYHFEVRSVSALLCSLHAVYLADRIPAHAFRRRCPAMWRSYNNQFLTCVVDFRVSVFTSAVTFGIVDEHRNKE